MTDNQDYQWDSADGSDGWAQPHPASSPPEPETTAWISPPGLSPQDTPSPSGRRSPTVPVLLGVAALAVLTTALVMYLLLRTGGDPADSDVVEQAAPAPTAPVTDVVSGNAPDESAAPATSAEPVVRTAAPKKDYPTQFTGSGWDLKADRPIAACAPGEDAVLAARNDSVFVTICGNGSGNTYHGFVTGTGALDWAVDGSRSDPDSHRYVVDTGDAEITVTPTRLTVYVGRSLEMDETFDEWWIDAS